jgi:plasmid stabilization system protein ParE
MNWTVVIAPFAFRDMNEIFDWIAQRSALGAVAWRQAADDAVLAIARNPLSCSLAPENDLSQFEIRNQFFRTRRGRTYRMVFYIDGTTAVVSHVRGPGQRFISRDELP